jgi:predicted RNA-binding Zn-ribbon protein involved in translation (DUF1610 family)
MATRSIDPDTAKHRDDEDWEGNNAAFTCPACRKVFIVSEPIHKGSRPCPRCGKSIGHINGGRKSGGSAHLTWDDIPWWNALFSKLRQITKRN